MQSNLIIDCEIAIAFSGLWGGKARIYELPIGVVTFSRLNSDRAKIAALSFGYSPAIDLPHQMQNDDGIYINQWVLTSEQVCPILVINNCAAYGTDFFDPCPTRVELDTIESLVIEAD